MKALSDIKFGQTICDMLVEMKPVTYDQLLKHSNINKKQLQKTIADLCKAGYVQKTDRGYQLVMEEIEIGDIDEQETIAGL